MRQVPGGLPGHICMRMTKLGVEMLLLRLAVDFVPDRGDASLCQTTADKVMSSGMPG